MDDRVYTYVAFDELEYEPGHAERALAWDGEAWIGGDFDRLWLRLDGEHATRGGGGGFAAQALYSRTISAFWNAQAGIRVDRRYGGGAGATRGLLALGFAGLAPYWFEVESFVFLGDDGDLSAALEASYDLLLTQRLILEPEMEISLASRSRPRLGVGSGLDAVELGARLRYEVRRELAPYVGWVWHRGREAAPGGGDAALERGSAWVAGLRWWY